MAEEIKLTEVEVTKIRARPGDVVVFSVPADKPQSWLQKMASMMVRLLPRNPCLIISGQVKVHVIPKEEAAKQEAPGAR